MTSQTTPINQTGGPTMNSRLPIRQGDVILIPTSTIPTEATPVPAEHGRLILARGEVTGHHHSVPVLDAELLAIPGTAEAADRFLRVTRETSLDHQEHGTLPVPVGAYLLRRQREYQPEAIRYVAD